MDVKGHLEFSEMKGISDLAQRTVETRKDVVYPLDPSQKFDLDPSRTLGQLLGPGRRISTRIHDQDFDLDPSRIHDLDPGRYFGRFSIPARGTSTRIHDQDFDLDPSRVYDMGLGQI
ncbi:hypothetical protein AgCh_033868 [Apium graveolens]